MMKQMLTLTDTNPRPTIPAPKSENEFSGWGPRLRY
jgi:hypothetical protein